MNTAVQTALSANTLILVDVNWRPVFFADPGEKTKEKIAEFVKLADIVKLTDEECEWLFGSDPTTVFEDPLQVRIFKPYWDCDNQTKNIRYALNNSKNRYSHACLRRLCSPLPNTNSNVC